MSDPQKYTLNEQKVRKFYSNLIESKVLTAEDLGLEDEFVQKINGDPDKLLKVRSNIIGAGLFSEDELGGNEAMFSQPFLKKKDVPLISSRNLSIIQEESSEPKTIEPTEEPDKVDLSYQDYNNQTIFDPNQSAPIASSYKNQYLADHRNDEAVRVVEAQTDKDMHDVSNVIAEDRKTLNLNMDEKEMKEHMDKVEDDLETKFNKQDSKSTTVRIRNQMAEGYKDYFVDDLDGSLKVRGLSHYDAMMSPDAIEEWRKQYKRKVPGEVLDAAVAEFQSEFNSIVIDNENQKYIQPKVQEYKDRGYSEEESLRLVMNEYDVQKRKHFEANMNGQTIKRYEIQNQIDYLSIEKPEDWKDTVYDLQDQLDGMGPTLYDTSGRRIIMPEVEELKSYELEVNAAIDEISEEMPNFKENLDQMYDEEFMVYKNIERQLEAIDTAEFDSPMAQPGMGAGGGAVIVPEQRKRYQHLKQLYGDQKIRVDALGRMKFANENIGLTNKGETKGYYGQIYTDAIREANHKLFMPKTTKAEEVAEYGEVMSELGEALSEEEMENIAPDMKDMLAESSGYMTDFVVKLLLAEATLGAVGVPAALTAFNSARRIRTLRKIVKAGKTGRARFALNTTNKLEQSIIKAGMNEVRFGVAGADPGHGAAFHYVDNAVGRVIPVLLKRGNKHLALIANSLARNPMTMTASMEIVATAQGAIHALANDKIVSEEMKLLFGDTDETMKRIAVELMVGSMFGFGQAVKASHRGLFQVTPDYVTKLQMKALKNGRSDVAAELGNIKFKLVEIDWAAQQATRTQKKAKWLMENGVEAKELYAQKKSVKGKGNRLNVKKVNEEFEARAAEEIEIYDHVLGKGSLEAMQAKAKILKKSGVDIEGHSPGNIEVIYESHQTKVKYAKKIQKHTERYEISKRRKSAKDIIKSMKEENIGEGYSESTDADLKMRKSKQIERSEAEREHMKSYRRTRRDTSKNRLDQWGEKYKRAVQGDWAGEAKPLTEQMLGTVGESLAMLKGAGIKKGKHYDKLKAAETVLKNSLKNEKALTNEQADMLTKRITDSRVAFTNTAMRKGINDLIKKPTKKTTDRLDPQGIDVKTSFLMKAIDRMFNKAQTKEAYITAKDAKAEQALKRLDEFKQTELQVEEMLKAKEKDPLLHEGQDFTVYEGVRNAMKNGKTYENALARRAELRIEAENRALTEREMIEYEVLGFADGSKMSTYQLSEAARAMRSLINNGRTEFKVKQEHAQLREKFERYNVVRAIDPKSVDVNAKLIEPNLTGLNLIQRAAKKTRTLTESFPTMMELLMSRTPGRKPLTGELHAYTDRALKAGNDKAADVGYFVKEMMDVQTQVFGNPKKADLKFKKWREEHNFEIIREVDGVVTTTYEPMSVQDALTIRAYARQNDQARTFENRGWNQDSYKHLENQIVKLGGKEALVWADAMVKGLLPRVWSRTNQRYKEDIGADLTIIENYFPVARKFDSKTGTGDPFKLGDTPLEHVRSTHTSSSKERNPDVANWYKLSKANDLAFNDILHKHIDRSMHYVHYQGLIKDMDAVFRNGDVKAVIEDGFTSNANTVIDAMITDMAKGRPGSGQEIFMADKLRVAFVRSKLGLNILLLPKQLMSVNAYQAEMSPAESAAFFKYMGSPSISTMKMLGRSRDIRLRYEKSQWDRDLAIVESGMTGAAGQAEGKVQLSRGKGLEKLSLNNMKDNMLIMTKYGDYGAIVYGGQAMYRVRLETYTKKGYSPAEAQQRAYNDFIKATRRTQQSGAVEDLSHIQKGSFGKLLTQFKNSPLQYLRGEHAAVTNMFEGFKQRDSAKFTQGLKNLLIYHVVLPQAFHAASNGFYLGDKDKKWLDDPMTLIALLGGSLSYMPILGSALTHLISTQVRGDSFGVDTGIGGDIVQEAEDMMTTVIDVINTAGDPGGFKLGADDILDFLSGAATYAGVPLESPRKIVQGAKSYIEGETDDELALLGYSPYMRGDYNRSRNFPIIHKHLPENGGDMGTMREEYAEQHGEAATKRAWPYLQSEYLMYQEFGGNDHHVNYLYMNLKTSDEKAKYIYDLYKRRVEGKRPLRRNLSVNEIIKDMETTDPEFMDMAARWMAFKVIDKSAFVKFITMVEEEFEEVYEY